MNAPSSVSTKLCDSVSKRLRGAEPGEAVGQEAHAGAELLRQAAPHQRVDAVGADHEVESGKLVERLDGAAELRRDADRRGARLQQLQQPQPADGGKAEAVDDDALPAQGQRHVVPGFHVRHDRRVGGLVVLAQEFQRAVGEHHAEAEGGVGRVLLDHGDVGASVAALDQIAEIEAGGTGAEDGDAHGRTVSHRRARRPPKSGGPQSAKRLRTIAD